MYKDIKEENGGEKKKIEKRALAVLLSAAVLFCGLYLLLDIKAMDLLTGTLNRINPVYSSLMNGLNLNEDLTGSPLYVNYPTENNDKSDTAGLSESGSNQEPKKEDIATNNSNQVAEYTGNYYGKLKVSGTKLCDINNNPVQLKGVSTHGLNYYPEYVNEETIKELKNDWGINVFRLALYTQESGGYTWTDEENKLYLESIIDDGVMACSSNDIYVIIDWHILSDGNPNNHLEESKLFFEKVTSKYNKFDNVIYEICNEPNGGTDWSEIKRYAEVIIPIIRSNDPDAVVLVGTPNWCQEVDVVAKDPLNFDNVMYTCHFYAGTHHSSYRKKAEKALKAGTPVFVSEYGLSSADGNGGLDISEGEKWMNFMDENNISSCMWSLCNKNESSAIINSWVTKTTGFSDEDLSEQGRWLKNVMLKSLR